jgi:hypothetical protein
VHLGFHPKLHSLRLSKPSLGLYRVCHEPDPGMPVRWLHELGGSKKDLARYFPGG